ncbi:MAG: TonB-dependent receptor [Segetibacter sp.]
MRRTPDRNTSDVLKRVSGASIQDDRFVVIRGLNDRYNAAFLNGAPLPSSESDRKAFAFDIFPSNILDNLVIYKTASSDMSGEFGGGLINVSTKSIPSQNFTTLSLGIGYNTLATFKDKTYYNGGKWDFIGLDDGTRTIPSQIPNIEVFNKLLPAEKAKYATYFTNNWGLKTKKALPYANIQFTKGLNIQRKGNDYLGMLFSLTYNHNPGHTEGERNIYDYDRSAAADAPQWKDKYYDRTSYTQTLLGGLANFSLKLNSKSTLNWKNILSINSDDRVIKREGTPDFTGDPNFIAKVNGRWFTSNTIYSTQLSGSHILNKSNLRFDWLGAYSFVKRAVPDLRQSIYFTSPDLPQPTADVASGRRYQIMEVRIFIPKQMKKLPVQRLILLNHFLWAEAYRICLSLEHLFKRRVRDFNARLLGLTQFNNGDVYFDQSILQLSEDRIFAAQNLGGQLTNGKGGFTLSDGTQPTYVYDANSSLSAGYVMLDQRFGKRIRAIYGVRLENYDQTLNSVNTNFSPVHISSSKLDFLPSVNLVYSLNTKQNLRFAFSKTLNRPEFREIAPFVFFDFVSRYSIEGDTSLQRASINNYDLRYEFYPGRSQLFSVSGFSKNFSNPIELVSSPNGSRTAVYQNAKSAKVYGIEGEVRSLIGTLFGSSEKSFLDKLTLSANLAILWSKIELNNFGQIDVKYLNSNRNLQGQSPYVFNSGLTYANDETGLSATLSANRVGPRIYIVGTKNDVDIYEQGRTVFDFQVAKSFKKDKWEVKLNAKDMLAQKQIFFYDIDQNKQYNSAADRIFARNKFGRVLSLTATYKF